MSGDLFGGVKENSGKPCRACNDFQQWMKEGPSEKDKDKENAARSPPQDSALEPDQSVTDHKAGVCPPGRGELGASSWALLHSVAAYFPAQPSPGQQEEAAQFMHLFSKLYPCHECAEDLKKDLAEEPPKVSSSAEFSQWMCELHNKVNLKLGKPVFVCSKVFQRWRDGWSDGSCD